MALARIRTHFPDEVTELREALVEAGYIVETLRPDEFRIAPADLELTVDKLPVVDAWRRIPQSDVLYVAPGTPESVDIRSAFGVEISREPWFARIIIESGELYGDVSRWAARQARELRARAHEARERWTPPREYQAPVHLEPAAPATIDPPAEPKEMRIDTAIEQALLRQEASRSRQEIEQRELQEKARLTEENRRRAREAAEAKALLEEQQKIEAMVRATEALRQEVVVANLPNPRAVERKKPRRLLRTRRDRAFVRAGIAAFALSLGLAVMAGEALHPWAVSRIVPQNTLPAGTVPFAKPPANTPASVEPQNATAEPPNAMPSFPSISTTAALQPSSSKASGTQRSISESMVADDEVIVRRSSVTHSQHSKSKPRVVHYSDLD
jgi:hypothetical protein